MLRGTLGTLSLPGVLQLLASEGRSGCLAIQAEGSGPSGKLWLTEGRIVHAECSRANGSSSGEDAAYDLMALEQGDFDFSEGVVADQRTVESSTEHLLMEAACRRDHRAREHGTTVLPEAVPAYAPVPAGGSTPRFDTLQWRLLASVDGRRSVAEIASGLDMSPSSVCTLVAELVAAGVLRIVP